MKNNVSDADPGGGDGIFWFLDKSATNLAAGGYGNGGSQTFASAAGGTNLSELAVSVGDVIYLAVHPKGGYAYDLTLVELSISVTTPSTPSVTPSNCSMWNLADDFHTSPDQENPNPDSCNNPGTWNFMESASLTRDPQSYNLMPFFISSSNVWVGTHIDGNGQFPGVASSTSGSTRIANVHPAPDRMAIIAWRSPMDGYVSITGGVTDQDGNCGDGIQWYIDKNSTGIASGLFDNGGAQSFADGSGGTGLNALAVSVGDLIYLAIHPRGNYVCDTTRVDLTISQMAITPTLTPTPTGTGTPTTTSTPTVTATPTATGTPTPAGQIAITYDYDKLYRLTKATYSDGRFYNYAYDAVGNRTAASSYLSPEVTYQYDDANRLSSVTDPLAGTLSYSFDANGNLLSDGVNIYDYDAANRLSSVSDQSAVTSYRYIMGLATVCRRLSAGRRPPSPWTLRLRSVQA